MLFRSGVEGTEKELIEKALLKFTKEVPEDERRLTTADLFKFGLSGKSDSGERRKKLLKIMGLPTHLNANSLLKVLNTNYTFDEAVKLLGEEKY